jgi:hypothetical protein
MMVYRLAKSITLFDTSPGKVSIPALLREQIHCCNSAYKKPDKRVAMPRKAKKPVTSVMVVRMIEEDWAGS